MNTKTEAAQPSNTAGRRITLLSADSKSAGTARLRSLLGALGVGDVETNCEQQLLHTLTRPDTVWRTLKSGWQKSAPIRDIKSDAVRMLQQQKNSGKPQYLKGAGYGALTPFWLEAGDEAGTDVATILLVEEPSAPALNGASTPLAHHLAWLRNILEAECHTRTRPRVFIDLDQLRDAPIETATTMATTLGLSWPKNPNEIVKAGLATVSSGNRGSAETAALPPLVRQWCANCLDILQGWAKGRPQSATDFAMLDGIRAEFAAVEPALAENLRVAGQDAATVPSSNPEGAVEMQASSDSANEIDQLKDALHEALAARKALEHSVAELQSALAQRRAEIDDMTSEQKETLALKSDIKALNLALSESEAQQKASELMAQRMETQLAALIQDIRTTSEANAQATIRYAEDLRERESAIAILVKREAALNQKYDTLLKEYEALTADQKQRDTEFAQLKETLAKRDRELGQRGEAMKARDVEIAELKETLARRIRELGQRGAAMKTRDMEIGQLTETLAKRDRELNQRGETIKKRDVEIGQLTETLAKRDRELNQRGEAIKKRDVEIDELTETLAKRDRELNQRGEAIKKRDVEIDELTETLAKRDRELNQRGEAIKKRDVEIDELTETLAKRDRELNQRGEAMKARAIDIAELGKTLQDAEGRVTEMGTQIKQAETDLAARDQAVAAANEQIKGMTEALADRDLMLHARQDSSKIYALLLANPPKWWMGKAARVRHNMALVKASGLFAPDDYLNLNKDVAEAGCDPLEHFVNFGLDEGRPPNQKSKDE